jgi:hypothetical protein
MRIVSTPSVTGVLWQDDRDPNPFFSRVHTIPQFRGRLPCPLVHIAFGVGAASHRFLLVLHNLTRLQFGSQDSQLRSTVATPATSITYHLPRRPRDLQ